MDEPKNTPNSEVDLSDSWTIVNSDDSEANANTETVETSDSESLEVLEVEQESEHHHQDDIEIEGEENGSEECSKDCHDRFLFEDPLIHLAAVQKVRTYVHHPSAYINMWLSVAMVIAIAVTLGLGIGHYLGSKRFARAKDMIHHLKYENRILEQELADVTMKNKHCERDLSRVRQQVVKLNQSEISDSYCRSSHFQGTYANLMNGHDEDVCYVEENPLFANFLKHSFVNDTLSPFLYWISYMNDEKQVLDYPFEDKFTINRSHIAKKSDNASSELHPELEVINDEKHSNTSHFQFSKLNTQLTYLHFLLKKWNEFRGNLKLPASDSKSEGFVGLQNTEHLSEEAHTVMPAVSGSPYKVSNTNVKHRLANSSNGFCRSKINQCMLHEKRQKKEKKCYALTKAQLLCSLLQRSKRKQGRNFLLGKQKAHAKKDKKQEVPQFSIEQKRLRKVEKTEFISEKKKGKNAEKQNYSELDSKSVKKKDKVENSAKKVVRKEKNNKNKYITRNQKSVDKKDQELYQSRKHFTYLQEQKKQLPKPVTKYKHFKNYYSKENNKNKRKQHITWDKNKRKYKEKFQSSEKMNRKNAEKFISCSNDQRSCKFHKNYKKMIDDRKYFAFSKFGSSKKAFKDSEKFSSSKNVKRNTVKNFEKCSSDEGHRMFYSSNKKLSEDRKHNKFASTGNSYKFKTQSNEKNDRENASCKYSFFTHQNDENFPKYLKGRGKMYDLHMQEINIFKT